MVVIRLRRLGANKRPFYHVIVADQRFAASGRFIEQLGFYNPIASGKEVRLRLDVEKINAWIAKGAQPTARVKRLLKENEMGEEAVLKAKQEKHEKAVAAKKAAKAEAEKKAAEEAKAAEAPAEGAQA
jgi:small subunit ribosomal protein S16